MDVDDNPKTTGLEAWCFSLLNQRPLSQGVRDSFGWARTEFRNVGGAISDEDNA